MSAPPRETIQKQIQQDWANRDDSVTNNFPEACCVKEYFSEENLIVVDMSCRSRLATLNEKLTSLERKIDYLEACVTKGETLT
ncbi:putative syntaxin interacting protein 1 [Operophtera brumata]|uniref:Putative syntaxin interacting protein 1 n=1 Tax=Operophtera brumata TaxID=104452 RepID=A0A0L7LDV9_OPEBR|nr:putative syntaxin interacting protein 1 [Operophtera brumata]